MRVTRSAFLPPTVRPRSLPLFFRGDAVNNGRSLNSLVRPSSTKAPISDTSFSVPSYWPPTSTVSMVSFSTGALVSFSYKDSFATGASAADATSSTAKPTPRALVTTSSDWMSMRESTDRRTQAFWGATYAALSSRVSKMDESSDSKSVFILSSAPDKEKTPFAAVISPTSTKGLISETIFTVPPPTSTESSINSGSSDFIVSAIFFLSRSTDSTRTDTFCPMDTTSATLATISSASCFLCTRPYRFGPKATKAP
mmetsp:Transcript_79653/g.155886  ORF Transcript_79653/g.155886 Transcript_79653/m.155886 type:complete len:255 (-) Transcript_79653:798-1562(-)